MPRGKKELAEQIISFAVVAYVCVFANAALHRTAALCLLHSWRSASPCSG
jgi:hypothetical protein